MCSSWRSLCSQEISATMSTRLWYSASVLDRAIKGCFFDHQETRFGTRDTHDPNVDLRSSVLLAQSISQNPLKLREDDFMRCNS